MLKGHVGKTVLHLSFFKRELFVRHVFIYINHYISIFMLILIANGIQNTFILLIFVLNLTFAINHDYQLSHIFLMLTPRSYLILCTTFLIWKWTKELTTQIILFKTRSILGSFLSFFSLPFYSIISNLHRVLI